MQTLVSTVVPYLLPPLVTLASILVPALCVYAMKWMAAHTKSTTLQAVVDRATQDIEAVVAELAQHADKLRDPVTGTLSMVAAVELKDAALTQLKTLWGPAGITELGKVLGIDLTQIPAWLSAHVERAVRSDQNKPLRLPPDPVAAPAVATAPLSITSAK